MNKVVMQGKTKARRAARVRSKIFGTALRPRLSVFKSNRYLFAQIINDDLGVTLASAHAKELTTKLTKTEAALALGKKLAEKAKAAKVTQVVFDRGANLYHGRIKALADGAREGGLEF
jgi:large subunit ribosomal protein L18